MPNTPASLQPLRIATIQMESVPVDKAANFAKIRRLAAAAAARGAQVMIFPELCTTGYWHLLQLNERDDLRGLAEAVPAGPSTQALLGLASEHGRILAETWKADDDIVCATLDPALLRGTLGDMFIRTRRPELYQPLIQATGSEVDVRQARFAAEYH